MKCINFYKIEGSGNDFIVIDNRRRIFPAENKNLLRRICVRRTGIGADGVLLLSASRRADFKMRIFNPDGTEAEMCGNGARCIGLFAQTLGLIQRHFTMETTAGIIEGKVTNRNNIKIKMGAPGEIKKEPPVIVSGKKIKIHTINTGVPHAIIFVRRIDNIDVEGLGRRVRRLKRFQPEGTNVDFVKITAKNRIRVRTYERGVERETLACGTGAMACAVTACALYGLRSPVYVETKSGDTLLVDTDGMSLTGPARIVFKGGLL